MDEHELDRRFKFYPADEDAADKHGSVRDVCRDAAGHLLFLTGPPSREQSLAITALEEAMMWANAAIARPQEGARP